MRTLSKRAIASRANGAKSQGPTSSAGKGRSSANSTRHGLLAKSIVLTNESESVFQQFFDEHLQKLNPADGVEYAVVEEIAVAAWRLRRVWNVESTLFNKAIGRSAENSAPGRAADAFTSLGANNQLQLLDRYETRLQRMYQRALKTLEQLRKVPQVQPYPEPNEPILKRTEYREGMVIPELPNEPNSDLTISPDNDLPTPIPVEEPAPNPDQPENSKQDPEVVAQEVAEVVAQAVPPTALEVPDTNQPSLTDQTQSRQPSDPPTFQLIEFPSKT
jgi:hypothetical protein